MSGTQKRLDHPRAKRGNFTSGPPTLSWPGQEHENAFSNLPTVPSGGDWAHVPVLGVAPCRCTHPRGVPAGSNCPVHPRPRVHGGAIWVVVAAGPEFPPNMAERLVLAAAPEFSPNMAETYRRLEHVPV